jgi:hypothetical protein
MPKVVDHKQTERFRVGNDRFIVLCPDGTGTVSKEDDVTPFRWKQEGKTVTASALDGTPLAAVYTRAIRGRLITTKSAKDRAYL